MLYRCRPEQWLSLTFLSGSENQLVFTTTETETCRFSLPQKQRNSAVTQGVIDTAVFKHGHCKNQLFLLPWRETQGGIDTACFSTTERNSALTHGGIGRAQTPPRQNGDYFLGKDAMAKATSYNMPTQIAPDVIAMYYSYR